MHQISIEKDFHVSAEQLFQAWTDPQALKQWWHPMGNDLIEVQNELKPGGTVRYVFQTGNGQAPVEVSGQYQTVKPNRQLVYTWNWLLPQANLGNGHFKLTIGFEPKGTHTKLFVLQDNFDSEEAVRPHQEGWERALNDLEAYLSKKENQ